MARRFAALALVWIATTHGAPRRRYPPKGSRRAADAKKGAPRRQGAPRKHKPHRASRRELPEASAPRSFHRPAAPHCSERGRAMVAFGAHTDAPFVQNELKRLVEAAQTMTCPPHDVVLFVDGSKQYKVLRHPLGDAGTTIRVPFRRLLRNGTTAFRAFVSHQLLMAAVPTHLARSRVYEHVWVVEEDAKYVGGPWDELWRRHNASAADLIAHARDTRNGRAALLPVARLSTRLLRAVVQDLGRIDRKEPGSPRRRIHGAFTYQLCRGRRWCGFDEIGADWLGIYRAKCAWNGKRFDRLAPAWHNPAPHGLLFHPVKLDAPTSGREFKHFNCAKQFEKELEANKRAAAGAVAASLESLEKDLAETNREAVAADPVLTVAAPFEAAADPL